MQQEKQAAGAEERALSEGNSASRLHPRSHSQKELSVSSTHTAAHAPHEQLQVFAELLLMHSRLRAGLSADAWFPADRFVIQFQQHKCALWTPSCA
jgi:hypothetical protein